MSGLVQLLATDDLPIERAALAIARDINPSLDVEAWVGRIDKLAAPLGPLGAELTPRAQAEKLASYLFETQGFHGNTADYYEPDNSYLDRVIDRRVGLPITLTVLLIAVARRAGAQVDGVAFPGHFLARVGGPNGLLMDPFHRGRILEGGDLEQLVRRFLGDPSRLRPEHLRAADTRAIVLRMLLNLKHAHERRGDHGRALIACDRLVDLTGAPDHRRDRGMLALVLGSYGAARQDLRDYLEARPTAPDVIVVQSALAQAESRVRPAN